MARRAVERSARSATEKLLSLRVRVSEHFFDDGRRVDYQAHALVPELRGASEAAHRGQRGAERFDDDVLLTDQVIDEQTEAAVADGRNDHERTVRPRGLQP